MEDNYFIILWSFLPYINMNRPHVYMCPPYPEPLHTSLSPHPSGLSQSTGFGCPVSCMELALVIYFTYGDVHVSVLFSQIIPPLPSPKVCSLCLYLLRCTACRIVGTVFLNFIYMQFRMVVMTILYARQWKRHSCKEQTFGISGRRQGWDDLRE